MDRSAPAGWYADPDAPGGLRFWDGERWTDERVPAPVAATPAPPSPWGNAPATWPAPSTPPRWAPTDPGSFASPPMSKPGRARAAALALVVVSVVTAAVGGAIAVSVARSTTRRAASTGTPLVSAPTDSGAAQYRPPVDRRGDPDVIEFRRKVDSVDAPPGAVPDELFRVSAGPNVISFNDAASVVRAMWPLRMHAIATQSIVELARIETGSALAVDAERGCGCGDNDVFGPATTINVAVPRAHGFPASFFAQVDTTLNNTPWSAVLVFTRATRRAPWKLALAGGGHPLVADHQYAFDLRADLAVPDVPPAVRAEAAALAPALARYWQAAKDGTAPPSRPQWAPATMTTEWATQLAQNRQGRPQVTGILGYYRYYVDPTTPTFVVPMRGGWYVACASILGQDTYVAPAHQRLWQSANREEWGADVPPGGYRAVVEIDDYVPCFQFTASSASVVVDGTTPPDIIATVTVR